MITIKDVEHVAKLARLELTEQEKEVFTHQLGDVLAHVEKMNAVDTTGVEPLVSPFNEGMRLRDDKVVEGKQSTAILENAPEKGFGYFVVPKVVE